VVMIQLVSTMGMSVPSFFSAIIFAFHSVIYGMNIQVWDEWQFV
jgi:hypothetical protein